MNMHRGGEKGAPGSVPYTGQDLQMSSSLSRLYMDMHCT